ncbi:MAG: Tn3 family transposase, partial [Caulobacteraceae bacterium]|nr:Tn3 family transposase [Caulobacteraceae bacterium]
RGAASQLGCALQLCAFRYPGRLLRPGEAIPEPALRFLAGQLHVGLDALGAYAARLQTRREQLDGLRAAFGFRMYAPGDGREMLAWLLPVALATTDARAIAATLMDELRRRRIVTSGPSTVERLVAAALVLAERHVAGQLTRGLSTAQADALDALLTLKEGTAVSGLAWARQPPGAPGHKALKRVVEQLASLRALGLDPACAEGVHPERLRKLAREGGRFTAQHLRALSPLRRHATLVATVLDTTTRLIDDGVGLFDRAVGRMFRRAEASEERAVLRDTRAVNDKVRLFAKLGAALIAAKRAGADLDGAVDVAVGWGRLATSVAEAERLARPDKADLPALAARAWPVMHRLGPAFLDAFPLRAVPAASATLRAVELLRQVYGGEGRRWPQSLPTGFLRPAWRDALLSAGATGSAAHRRTWEAATLLALCERLRAGDIWVEGSRQWRAVEDQLIPPALFAAMREAGPLPVAVPASAEEYLAERRALLDRRLAEVEAKAVADRLEDVRIKTGELTISPLKAVTPEEAEDLADRLYGMVPSARVTSVLAEVDRWTGFSSAFTHLHTGRPADDPRVVLTAMLAGATNLGLTRMAEACAVASYRQLAWIDAWHLREETYRGGLAILTNAQQRQPLAALFGAPDVSSSDGQHFHTAAQGEALGAYNARHGQEPTALFYTHVSGRHAPF